MTHRMTTNYAKNYCNRTLIVKVIVENVVTCFLLGHSVYILAIDLLELHVRYQNELYLPDSYTTVTLFH